MKKNINSLAAEIAKDVQRKVATIIAEEMHNATFDAIDNFYLDISPKHYDRNEELYKAFHDIPIEQLANGSYKCGVIVNAEKMNTDKHNARRTERSKITPEDLFRYTVVGGYHGFHEHRSKPPIEEINKSYKLIKKNIPNYVKLAFDQSVSKIVK